MLLIVGSGYSDSKYAEDLGEFDTGNPVANDIV